MIIKKHHWVNDSLLVWGKRFPSRIQRDLPGCLPKAWIATVSNFKTHTFSGRPPKNNLPKRSMIKGIYIYICCIHVAITTIFHLFPLHQVEVSYQTPWSSSNCTYQTWGVLRLVHFTQKKASEFPQGKVMPSPTTRWFRIGKKSISSPNCDHTSLRMRNTGFSLNSTWELEPIFNKQPRLRESPPTKSPTPRPYSGRGKKSKSWKHQRPVVIPATHGVELLSNLGKIWPVSTWFFFEKDEISQQGYVSTRVFSTPPPKWDK